MPIERARRYLALPPERVRGIVQQIGLQETYQATVQAMANAPTQEAYTQLLIDFLHAPTTTAAQLKLYAVGARQWAMRDPIVEAAALVAGVFVGLAVFALTWIIRGSSIETIGISLVLGTISGFVAGAAMAAFSGGNGMTDVLDFREAMRDALLQQAHQARTTGRPPRLATSAQTTR